MLILFVFAFVSGLVTILAPCIWPLLPIVLSASTSGGRKKPLGITLGIIASFAFFTLTISYLVSVFHFDPNMLRSVAVVVIGFLGLTLIVPTLSRTLEALVSSLSGKIGSRLTSRSSSGFTGGLITGIALGIIWSPCAGPILATIATLAATQAVNRELILVTLVYVTGVGIPLFAFSYLGSQFFNKSRFISKYTGRVQQIFGVIMILTALAIYTNWDKTIQAKLLDAVPSYSSLLTKFESQKAISDQLDILKGKKDMKDFEQQTKTSTSTLPSLGKAPDFAGISNWLNSKPLSIQDLKGKVVLVDFWTYTCINCIRTLPYVTSWYDKYHDRGFVVVGVHTPEFEFEKKTENVANAIKQYKINYPVAQDNDYKTWDAYNNRYWPAKYLIDANGNIRYTHFGEGDYDKTERAIQDLLKEAGANPNQNATLLPDQTPKGRITPETYLGKKRMDNSPYFSYSGQWQIADESAASTANSAINLHFYASKVFLVITPNQKGDTVKVFLDGKTINESQSGADVENGQIILDVDRLYNIVDLKNGAEDHILHLEFQNPNTRVFAFTFG